MNFHEKYPETGGVHIRMSIHCLLLALGTPRDNPFRKTEQPRVFENAGVFSMVLEPPGSAECEAEHVHAWIEEFDFERPVIHRTTLTHELIQTRARHRAGPVAGDVRTVPVAGRLAVDRDPEAHGLAVRSRAQHQMEVAGVEAIRDPRVR